LAVPAARLCRDGLIRHLTSEHCDEFDHIRVRAPAVLAGAVLAHLQGRVVTAYPSDHEVQHVVLDPHDNLLDQCADDPLAGRRCRTGLCHARSISAPSASRR
jgi:hypothetical protein